MSVYFQDLAKEDREDGLKDIPLVHQRATLSFSPSMRDSLHFEWLIGKPAFRLRFHVSADYEHTVEINVALILFSFWFTIRSGRLAQWIHHRFNDCEYGSANGTLQIYWFENALWWSVFSNDWESSSDDPWWRKVYSLHFDDLIFGKAKYTRTVIDSQLVNIEMPEGEFVAEATRSNSQWKRPRWFARSVDSTSIDFKSERCKPPIFPGKWGDDGIWGVGFETLDVQEAARRYRDLVLEKRHG